MNLGRPGYRMRVLLRCLLTFVLSAYPALIHAQQRFTALILRHANVIPMSGEEVLPDRDVLIEGGVIQTISAERLKVAHSELLGETSCGPPGVSRVLRFNREVTLLQGDRSAYF